MRLLEVAILLALLFSVLGFLFARRAQPSVLRFVPWIGAALIVLHLAIEGYRWQMVPAYVLTAIFLLVSLRSRGGAPAGGRTVPASGWRKAGRFAGAVGLLLVFIFVAAPPALFPVFKLPKPSGSLAVGTTNISLLDPSRPEPFTTDESDRRDLAIQVWYPAVPAPGARPEPLLSKYSPPYGFLARVLGLSKLPFVFDHLALVKTHSYRDATLSDAQPRFPVLVFSHGYWGTPGQNTAQMEELASHGYIIFSIGHPYESTELRYPDGHAVRATEEFMARVEGYSRNPDFGKALWKLIGSKDPEERARMLQMNNAADKHFPRSLEVWTADTRFLFDELSKAEAVPALKRFAGHLDVARMGVFGMSFGGATAADVCFVDSRCRAGVNMDGVQFGGTTALDSSMKVPFMYMTSEPFALLADPPFRRAQPPTWLMSVAGSAHVSYTDTIMLSPMLSWLGVTGKISADRMERIMNAYLLAFFDQNLRGKRSVLLNGPDPAYPEVTLQVR